MSLTDALLREAYPLDVWIALRTDGAKGSGTENDPYDGKTRQPRPPSVGDGADPLRATDRHSQKGRLLAAFVVADILTNSKAKRDYQFSATCFWASSRRCSPRR